MNDEDKTRLEQELIRAKAVNLGLVAVLTDLVCAHSKQVGSSPEEGLLQSRSILDSSLAELRVKGTGPRGETIDAGPEIRRLATALLDTIEQNARRRLGLSPASRSKN